MSGKRSRWIGVSVVVAAAALWTGCNVKKTPAPPLAGPSELALSLAMTAVPDVLTQDGASRSEITITARGPNAEPMSNVRMRAEITVGGVPFDFGRLSTRNPVTDAAGRAGLTYTAPPLDGESVDNRTIVTILVTPAEGDNRNAFSRSIDIRLVPPGIILPPNTGPTAVFSFSPANPATFTEVIFDASASSDPDGTIVSYDWIFGDGSTGTGVQTTHEYKLPGEYSVVLTVTDNRGRSARSEPVQISVQATDPPTAAFTFSPTQPSTGEKVFFNAASSTAAIGRRIRRYEWNFGTSTSFSATGVTASKTYDVEGNYTVTLIVTDDVGQKGTASQQVPVGTGGAGGVTANFNFSPTNPTPGTTVFFDASGSTSPDRITRFHWNFGDGDTETDDDPSTSHLYPATGTFVVTLTITDSHGRTSQATQNVVVQEPTEEPEEEPLRAPGPD